MSKKLVWSSLIFIIMISVTALVMNKNQSGSEKPIIIENNALGDFTPKTVPQGSDSQYDIELTMTKDGTFNLETTVIINNIS
ncbi:hypothetical protein [Oceanobacillus senegalensis]|uniref:hypothetical protein n=1 Tax=Oceanobacillus senegalensis TaxID=1936063 RepID=UPI000A30C800|nr:hypothetical protein [Oceanobacillus senegalensis]